MSALLLDRTTVQLVREDCIHCGNVFGMSKQLQERRREDCKTFWCPGCGGSMVYRKSASQKRIELLERQVRNLADDRERLAGLTNSLRDEDRELAAQCQRLNKHRRRAFWLGVEAQRCGAKTCENPYATGHGGFRYAWIDGYEASSETVAP